MFLHAPILQEADHDVVGLFGHRQNETVPNLYSIRSIIASSFCGDACLGFARCGRIWQKRTHAYSHALMMTFQSAALIPDHVPDVFSTAAPPLVM